MKYEFIWSSKYVTSEAQNIDDFIILLEEDLNLVKEFKKAGVVLRKESMTNDVAIFETNSLEVAEKFAFEEIDWKDNFWSDEELWNTLEQQFLEDEKNNIDYKNSFYCPDE